MTLGGKLHIGVCWDGATVNAVAVQSSRPLQASRLMIGKPPQDAVKTMSLLFSICGRAQGVAAVMAAEAALGAEVGGPHMARMRLVFGETIQEHLRHILLDWPQQAGLPPQIQALAELCAGIGHAAKPLLATGSWQTIGGRPDVHHDDAWPALSRMLKDFLRREIFGCDPAQWLELGTQQELETWYGNVRTPAAQLLRCLAQHGRFGASKMAIMPAPDRAWLEEIAVALHGGAAFSHQPNWRGTALETGALARQLWHPLLQSLAAAEGNSIFARMVARMVELARLVESMHRDGATGGTGWGGSQFLGGGAGIAWVETARGLLVHHVASDGARILDYRTIAPTEWNFHADGALVRGMRGMAAANADAARNKAAWLVHSLDPCVAYEITVRQA